MNKDQFRRMLSHFLSVLLIFVLTYLYWVVWTTFYSRAIPDPFWNKGNWLVVAIYAVILYFFMQMYEGKNIADWGILDIIYSQCLSVVFSNLFIYLIISLLNRHMADATPIFWLTLFDFISVIAWTLFSKYIYRQTYKPRNILFIYGDRDPEDVVHKIDTRKDKYIISDKVSINQGIKYVESKINDYSAVLIGDIADEYRNDLIKYCYSLSVRAYVMPKLSDIILLGADNSNVFDTPLLICKNRGIRLERRIIKRFFDLVLIIPIGLITLPINLIFAVIIKLYDGGDVLYKQKRLTTGGKEFDIYKFRSMKMNSESDGAQLAKKHDDRITPIGNFLRKTHLDELPQIINIVKGDMSIVGPRPERPEIAAQYRESIPEFDFRLMAKAGLTGYAQVYGQYNTTPYDKLKLDLYYIEHQSTLLDLELILKTIRIAWKREKSEGIEETQKTALKNGK
jgi:exopolysaccharide biosynthesis polyprenyl glycosylphosphotransferase